MATARRTTKLDDDLTVSAIGFGAGALTSIYGAVDDAESLATLNRCLDLDVTFIDTANVYGGGNNERLIAKLLATAGTRSRWRRNSASPATRQTAPRSSSPSAATAPTCVSASTKALRGCRPTSLTCTTCTGVT